VTGERAGSRVVIDIAARENGCELTLTHELHPDWANFVGQAEEAWGQMLESLATVLDEAQS
jgi:hypothetical protein